MRENAWLTVKANLSLIYETPLERRWSAAAALVGVDLALLSDQAGHA